MRKLLLLSLLAMSAATAQACPADPQAVSPDVTSDVPFVVPDPGSGLELPPIADVPLKPPADTGEGDAPGGPDAADVPVTPDTPSVDTGPVEIPPRSCTHTFRFTPGPGDSVQSVNVPGTFNAWDVEGLPLAPDGSGDWVGTLELADLGKGSEGYKFLVNGVDDWRLDPSNIMLRFDDEIANSKLLVPDCHVPELVLVERTVDGSAGTARIEVAVHAGVGGELDLTSPQATHNFDALNGAWDAGRGTLLVDLSGLGPGKHSFRFDAAGPAGAADPLLVSFWVEDEPFDWRDAVLYFAFVDRFFDGDPALGQPASCSEADPWGNWRGGDWKGITQKINDGYFDDLGVNALWLNAPMDNPEDCVLGNGGYTYTAYHGYFPVDLYGVEKDHYGTLQDLRDLVSAAHGRGIRVLVDLTANHVYETAPEWSEHEFDGWFNTPIYVCGWDQPETCWFQSYLPDLNYRNDEVVEHLTEAALWWIREADLDGFRVDAVKHVHIHFLKTLRHKLDHFVEANSDSPFWTVGETFTGPWGGGTGSEEALIKEYIGLDRLYGQFDFPLYWALLGAVGRHEAGMTELADVLTGSAAYYGPSAIMASFLGNHDVSRFVSHANGDIADLWGNGSLEQGWENPPDQPAAAEPYQRLFQAFTFLAAIPYVPLIYYGDEVGLAGAGDPDCRRMMPWSDLSSHQTELRDKVSALMKARLASPALRRGSLSVPEVSDDVIAILRSQGSSYGLAVINRGVTAAQVSIDVGGSPTFSDVVDGSQLTASGGSVTVDVPGGSARLLTTP